MAAIEDARAPGGEGAADDRAGVGRDRPGDRDQSSTPDVGTRIAFSNAHVYGWRGSTNAVVGPDSTTRPAYMTTMRSHTSATTPRSCVMRTTEMPSRTCRSRSSVRICAWIVTSSAVVGSSAISKAGSHDSAIAIITRCFCPPESWCGYDVTIRSTSGRPTETSVSSAFAWAADRESPRC